MNAQNLLDKYIKYDSKITFDIFKLMYQKLIDLGFISPHKVEYAFQEFSGKYNYFVMKVYDDDLYFNQYASAEKQQSEITVKDLLGYNPFESFKLPEKWYIEVGENAKIIDKWKQTTNYKDPASNFKYVTCRGSGYVNKSDYTDHSEITFDQFKQYVLKEPIVTKPPKPFPSRWCIELNETTIPIVGNYYNKKHLEDPNCVTYTEFAEGYYVCSHNDRGEYVKNGYTACSFFTTPSDDCPEITLEDFKQFVMEETTSKPKIESKEDNPEYVECSYSDSDTFILNKIYKCCTGSTSDRLNLVSETGTKLNLPYEGSVWKFKPSTKEAFELQTKSLEKWSVGSYIVPLQNKLLTRTEPLIKGKPYQITKRSSVPYIMCEKGMEINFSDKFDPETTEGIKWFATLKEAEEFAKTLIPPSKFKIGDSIQANPGGSEYEENGLEQPSAISYLKVDEVQTGKCTKITYSQQHRCYWYKIDDYGNMFTEDCITLAEVKSDDLCTTFKYKKGECYVVTEECEGRYGTLNFCYQAIKDDNICIYFEPSSCISTKYTSVRPATFAETKEYIRQGTPYNISLLKNPKSMHNFPIEGKCKTKDVKLEDYLIRTKGRTDSKMSKERATGIAWNANSYWWVLDISGSTKTLYSLDYLLDCISDNSPAKINTYGLNVGDALKNEIITAWESNGLNFLSDNGEPQWKKGSGNGYNYDRTIEDFKVFDEVVGFLVSGTLNVYLRAEGFKEFAENFTKSEFSSDKVEITPKFEAGKWYRITDGKSKCIGKDIWYAKSIVVCDNIIIAGEYWHNYLDTNGNFGNVGDYTFTEVPLSEIQWFLPDGHSDKIVNEAQKVIKTETYRVRVTSSEIKVLKI